MNATDNRRYDMARSHGPRFFVELTITPTFGGTTKCENFHDADALRARVAQLRGRGFTRGKLLGGLDRALRILGGLPVAEVVR